MNWNVIHCLLPTRPLTPAATSLTPFTVVSVYAKSSCFKRENRSHTNQCFAFMKRVYFLVLLTQSTCVQTCPLTIWSASFDLPCFVVISQPTEMNLEQFSAKIFFFGRFDFWNSSFSALEEGWSCQEQYANNCQVICSSGISRRVLWGREPTKKRSLDEPPRIPVRFMERPLITELGDRVVQ